MDSNQKLNVNDLISSLNKNQQSADKKLTQLNQGSKRLNKQKTRLNKRISKQQTREINNTIVNAELTTYQPLVKKNREATNLDFRELQTFHSENKKTTEEDEFTKLAASGGLSSHKDLNKKETELVNKTDVGELLKAKRLLLYKEVKQKRIKKIKSKMYHRIKKKQKERQKAAEMANAMRNNQSLVYEELAKMEYRRAEERANLKHRTNNKYIKMLKKYGDDKELKWVNKIGLYQPQLPEERDHR